MHKINEKSTIWVEKYRPQDVRDLLIPDNFKSKLQKYVEMKEIPNLGLWSSSPGTGKTSTANAIIKSINAEALFVNASLDNGIDMLRTKIQNFASTESFDGLKKIVVLDECLEENEKVIILDENNNITHKKLNELEKGKVYKCKSLNLETGKIENDTCEIISDKTDDIYEVELEDGRKIKVTSNHPFIIHKNSKLVEKSINDGLKIGDDVACLDINKNVNHNLHFKSIRSVESIKKIGKARVINLTVHKNHTFITENGIITHNCDNLSANSQFGFRSLIETFSNNCRFILTGNYKERIIEPLRDRIENYDFGMFSKDEIVKSILERLIFILKNEKIEFNPKDLVQIINSFYPSIRSMIMNLQKFSKSGKLEIQNLDNKDRYAEILGLINKKDFLKMIELVNNLENPDNLFTYFYDNFEKFTSRQNLPRIIVTIGKYQSYSSNAKDKHLNIAAMCSELMAL